MAQMTLDADEDLEALFDRVAEERARAPAAAAPGTGEVCAAGESGPHDVFQRVGSITRTLHDALRALGYDREIGSAVQSLPDAQARLAYIATLTGRAAERALNAVEQGKLVQDRVSSDATRLSAQWEQMVANPGGPQEFRALAQETRAFLAGLPDSAAQTNAQLHEIMMAQDFHDLTGQTVERIARIAQSLEEQLVKLLIDSTPSGQRARIDDEWLSGPAIDPKQAGVVANQNQVDQLLETLGF